MPSRKLTFEGATGDELVGRLETPPGGEPAAYALFAHCFTCSKDLKAAVNVSRELAARRIAVLRFDFTGLGESEGDFADTDFSSNVEDLVAAAEYLEREHRAPSVLVGHSLGGAAVLQAASRIPSSEAVATIGAPAHPGHVKRHLTGSIGEIEERGEAEVTLAGRSFTIRKNFLDDLEETRMEETVAGLDRALLIFHSPLDDTVGIENAAKLYRWAKHPKSFISLDRADHLLLDPADSRYVGTVLAAWARKYLEGLEVDEGEDRLPDDWSVPEDQVAARIGTDHYRTDLLAAGHPLVADEPEDAGGTDQGPSPYDLLSAALGACTAMTLRMYADHKEWPLESVEVRLEHGKVHAEDDQRACRDEDAPDKIDRIERVLAVEGDLTDEQRARLVEIADRCPVHKTLHHGIVSETRLAD